MAAYIPSHLSCCVCYYYYNHFTALWILSRTTWVSLYQKKRSPTHTDLIVNHPLSASSIYCDPRHLPCWIYVHHSLCATSVQVFFGLPLGLAPSTSYSIHFFTQLLSSFCSTCPYHHNLFCCSTIEIILSNPSLSLSTLIRTLSFTLMPHIRLTILISACWSATSFSFLTGQAHFHASYYFAHNCCTISLSLSMIYPYW